MVYNYPYAGPSSYSFEAYVNVNPVSSLTLGQEVTGTIANPGDEATYTFTGSPGQEIYYDGLASASGIQATLTDPGATANDEFGFSVAISGSTVVAGAPGNGAGPPVPMDCFGSSVERARPPAPGSWCFLPAAEAALSRPVVILSSGAP